jgi:hypothetical protein
VRGDKIESHSQIRSGSGLHREPPHQPVTRGRTEETLTPNLRVAA